MTEILFLYKGQVQQETQDFDATRPFGLINSSNFLHEFLTSIGISSLEQTCRDGLDIHPHVIFANPQVVVLEALWASPSLLSELCTLHPNVEWIVRIHSTFGFIISEWNAFTWFKEMHELNLQGKKVYLAANHYSFYEEIVKLYSSDFCLYLPNVYSILEHDIDNFKMINSEKTHLDIGCFGALRFMKNQTTQLISALSTAKHLDLHLKFHINSSTSDLQTQDVEKVLQDIIDYNVNAELIRHNWVSHPEFLDIISTMDMNYQLSFSESFNLISADSISSGVPIIVSKSIEWLSKSNLSVDNQNLIDITRTSLLLYRDQEFRYKEWKKQFYLLLSYNEEAKTVWKEKFNSLQ